MPIEKTSVLVVDDSLIFRRAVDMALAGEPDIHIAGSVRNGEKAIEFIRQSPPDIVTLDVEMPGMNGIETLKAIQEYNESRPDKPPIGVLMLSSLTRRGADVTMTALAAGAFDFIAKPMAENQDEGVESLKRQLSSKIRIWASRRRLPSEGQRQAPPQAPARAPECLETSKAGFEAIAIGVSTGGPKALNEMLPQLCQVSELPILIVQHMPPTFTKSLAEQLDNKCPHKVLEAKDGDPIKPRRVYIAPGGLHMLVRKSGASCAVALNEQPPENGCRPSVDVLFRSVAACYGPSAMAIILTGMGNDGAKATSALKRAGAPVIVQDEETSVVWGMPGSAVATGNVDEVRPLMQIPSAVKKRLAQT